MKYLIVCLVLLLPVNIDSQVSLNSITINIEIINQDGTIQIIECDTSEEIQYFLTERMIYINQCQNLRPGDIVFKDSFEYVSN